MRHAGKDGNRNNMSNTVTNVASNLRTLQGRWIVIHQTNTKGEQENGETGDDGVRVVKPPELTSYGETISVVQDASTVLAFDAIDGVGKIAVRKAREPAVGLVVDFIRILT